MVVITDDERIDCLQLGEQKDEQAKAMHRPQSGPRVRRMRILFNCAQRSDCVFVHFPISGSTASTQRSVSALSFSPCRAVNSNKAKSTEGSFTDESCRRKTRPST